MDSAAELPLVLHAQRGDATAFAQLAEQHGPRLARFLQTMTGDDHAAEDLRQDTLQRAFAKLPQLLDPAKFGSWLLSIACNRCRNHLRAEVQRAHAGDDALAEVAEGTLQVRVHRAKALLRQQLGDQVDTWWVRPR